MSLCSYRLSPTVCTEVSRRQLVSISAANPNAESMWVIDHVDPNLRFEMQGEVVRANDPVLLRSQHTCKYMAADLNTKYKNDFGTEFEVYCGMHSSKNLSQNLEMESIGRITGDLPTKFQEDFNVFFLQTSPEK